jgi:hypothetical protein
MPHALTVFILSTCGTSAVAGFLFIVRGYARTIVNNYHAEY